MPSKTPINEAVLARTVARCRERNIIIPTFAEQKDPSRIPEPIKKRLAGVGLWDVNPLNLFRITWKNEPKEKGGLFNQGNWIEFPRELTGVERPHRRAGRQVLPDRRPQGRRRLRLPGAAPGHAASSTPTTRRRSGPRTGNYCRGGAFDCALLGLQGDRHPARGDEPERFEWLREIGTDEIIATPGMRVERQGDLRQVLGAAARRAATRS